MLGNLGMKGIWMDCVKESWNMAPYIQFNTKFCARATGPGFDSNWWQSTNKIMLEVLLHKDLFYFRWLSIHLWYSQYEWSFSQWLYMPIANPAALLSVAATPGTIMSCSNCYFHRPSDCLRRWTLCRWPIAMYTHQIWLLVLMAWATPTPFHWKLKMQSRE